MQLKEKGCWGSWPPTFGSKNLLLLYANTKKEESSDTGTKIRNWINVAHRQETIGETNSVPPPNITSRLLNAICGARCSKGRQRLISAIGINSYQVIFGISRRINGNISCLLWHTCYVAGCNRSAVTDWRIRWKCIHTSAQNLDFYRQD